MKQITSLTHMDSNAMDLHSATGKLDYTLTNDFLFKALLQKNQKVLKALVASLMHLKIKDITSIHITNPIEPGNSVTSKTFYLDIRLILNRNTIINLEMQVLNKGYWPERSVGYLARSFDNLNRGKNYGSTKAAIQICFLNFDLPDIPPEFYGTYKLLNIKNHSKYSDKFTLSVVNLRHINLATNEDKKYGIDKWAALFKAATWEEIKMIAGKDEYLNEASEELFRLCAEDAVRAECEARKEYYEEKQYMTELKQEITEAKQEIAEVKKDNARKAQTIDALNDENQRLRQLLKENAISISF